jgi:hypothetical protein
MAQSLLQRDQTTHFASTFSIEAMIEGDYCVPTMETHRIKLGTTELWTS